MYAVSTPSDGQISHDGTAWAKLHADVPIRFAREAGMIMNELRAQLDHLANVLARRNGANEDGASFPLLSSENNLNATARHKIRRLSAVDQEKIFNLQPFRDGRYEILLHLNHADVFRKHQRPLGLMVEAAAAITTPGSIGMMTQSGGNHPLAQAGDRAELAYIRNTTVGLAPRFRLSVLEPEALRGFAIVSMINASIAAVYDIVREFNAPEKTSL
ncbi:hypothetical protein [Phenylobacterium sp.]|uniref:hypothetical protein n=1 Tax=Phenylobacterium sp. TaxID=1871053 RepID=UPI00286AC0A4|nr:hypothetical protein [Phenylobacterium sp.]